MIVLGAVLLASAGPAYPALYNLRGAPIASFVWSPQLPHIGDPITVRSTSIGVGSPLTKYAWDFADNGPFGEFEEGAPVAGKCLVCHAGVSRGETPRPRRPMASRVLPPRRSR